MNQRIYRTEARHALVFTGKVLLVIAGLVLALLLARISFQLSMWLGIAILCAYTVALYASARRWVAWLPGLLVFGVISSLFALVTGHSPNNNRIHVSAALALLLLAFYTVGTVLAYFCDAARLSPLDRCAWLLYLVLMIAPAFAPNGNQGSVTPVIAGSALGGMAVVSCSFVIHRRQGRREP